MTSSIDFEEIRFRNPLVEYCQARGIALRRCGSVWVGKCPMHNEKTPSFVVYPDQHWMCYGACQTHGDVVDLEIALSGCTNKEAIERLGGAAVAIRDIQTRQVIPHEKKLWFPDLQEPTKRDLIRLSVSRSIDVAPLSLASERGFLWCFDDERNGRCWLYTDQTRRCGLRRRLDGHPFLLANGGKTKSAACPGSDMSSPIGYREAHTYPCISVQEGGPDSLAALANAWASSVEPRVAPICMPCAGANFSETSLAYLQGKRARIFTHNDKPGNEAAHRWAKQLESAGITVDGYQFDGLIQADGCPVKDLNDLLLIDYDSWEANRATVESVMDFAFPAQGGTNGRSAYKFDVQLEDRDDGINDQGSGLKPLKDDGRLPQLILPSASVPNIESAQNCFSELAKTETFFTKGGVAMEALTIKGSTTLSELDSTEFQSRLEGHFTLWKWIVLPNGKLALKPSRCSTEAAKVMLKTKQRFLLPAVQLVTSSVLFVEREGKVEVLNKGYHDSLGGTLVTKRHKITEIPLEEAVRAILALLDDFLFVEPSDKSRALAGLISPALRLGGLLCCDFPLDMAEAEESQSGKTYRQHIIARLYGEEPEILNKKHAHEGGVGSLDENISTALLSGKPFLMFENVRDRIDSQILESALRGVGVVQVRKAYSEAKQVSTDRIIWLLSSNKSEVTRDLANRTIVTRIQKQPIGFAYKQFPEGDLKAHVTRNADYYLSCILAVVRHWHTKGKLGTNDNRHDFRQWSQTLDWIVQNVFHLAPLLDGHKAEQDRISDPAMNWLRDIALKIKKDGRLDEKFRPGEIADICAEHGIDIPGCQRTGMLADQVLLQTGKTLKRIFRDAQKKLVGGVLVEHSIGSEYNAQRQENLPVNFL